MMQMLQKTIAHLSKDPMPFNFPASEKNENLTKNSKKQIKSQTKELVTEGRFHRI